MRKKYPSDISKEQFEIIKPLLEEARKKPLKQVAMVGFDNLFLIALRLITPEQAAERISKRIGMKAKAVRCPYAEIAMDADKAEQLELLIKDLQSIIKMPLKKMVLIESFH